MKIITKKVSELSKSFLFSLIKHPISQILTLFLYSSLDLVDRLFSDLVATTQSYHQVQDRESRLSSDLGLIQSQLFPLRKENARLARENHDLHLDNIKLNEDMRLEMETFSKRIRLLNDEITELKAACLKQIFPEKSGKDFLYRLKSNNSLFIRA
ncbi:hypothetical protein EON65_30920 [archaeon]|nr:MAG: hypothetical protein EON65_30920 [archaeon]